MFLPTLVLRSCWARNRINRRRFRARGFTSGCPVFFRIEIFKLNFMRQCVSANTYLLINLPLAVFAMMTLTEENRAAHPLEITTSIILIYENKATHPVEIAETSAVC